MHYYIGLLLDQLLTARLAGQPRVNLGLTSGQPRGDLGATSGRPRATSGRPRGDLGATSGQPQGNHRAASV